MLQRSSQSVFLLSAAKFWDDMLRGTSDLRIDYDWFSGLHPALFQGVASSNLWKRVSAVDFKSLLKRKRLQKREGPYN